MTTEPRLTVAIPTYNGERHLSEALRSILAQAGAEFDLVVSDDRSEDRTLEIVRSEAGDRARISVNSERLGLAGNWNRCVALSQTPLVAVFHQDDVMRPGHLAAHLAAFSGSERIGLVASAADVIDADGTPVPESVVERGGLGANDRRFGPGEVVPEMVVGNPLRCSGVSIRVAAHADVGGFNPAYRYVVDWDFWLRVGQTWDVQWLARPTVAIRWHSASETHRFKAGTADLDETRAVLSGLLSTTAPEGAHLGRAANRKLARAYLNRAHDSACAGVPELARLCLGRATALWPGIVLRLAADPRLGARLAAATLAPGLARRWLGRRSAPGVHREPGGR